MDVERPVRGIGLVTAEYWARSVVVGRNTCEISYMSLACHLGGETE